MKGLFQRKSRIVSAVQGSFVLTMFQTQKVPHVEIFAFHLPDNQVVLRVEAKS